MLLLGRLRGLDEAHNEDELDKVVELGSVDYAVAILKVKPVGRMDKTGSELWFRVLGLFRRLGLITNVE